MGGGNHGGEMVVMVVVTVAQDTFASIRRVDAQVMAVHELTQEVSTS